MSLTVTIKPKVIKFSTQQLEQWKEEHDESSYGFGESIVGNYLKSQGYSVHQQYNICGGNKLGKYPEGEEIIRKYFGEERFWEARKLFEVFYPFRDPKRHPFEEPDLLVYKPDPEEMRLVEVKRLDTRDKLRKGQVKGLVLFAVLLNIPIDVYIAVPQGKEYSGEDIVWEF
ncbi:hypothetical protein [Clostridium ganghwense]|uniref:Endonuclease n=1 Tax=Clostridium ganghwense TaxID=312089 RepID=A0ABT4CTN9_9CLOT|nr:hypothetical protein [Clostridium ganghwense]MCY6372441.1 hypothetical protein [Clostridium ganghwense]